MWIEHARREIALARQPAARVGALEAVVVRKLEVGAVARTAASRATVVRVAAVRAAAARAAVARAATARAAVARAAVAQTASARARRLMVGHLQRVQNPLGATCTSRAARLE